MGGPEVTADWTLKELAVLEAARGSLAKTGRGKKFDAMIFRAVAESELRRLQEQVDG